MRSPPLLLLALPLSWQHHSCLAFSVPNKGGDQDYAFRRNTLADEDLLFDGKPSRRTGSSIRVQPTGGGSKATTIVRSSSSSSSTNPTASFSSIEQEQSKSDEDDQELSPQQAQAIDLFREGHNVFVTGVAGTGKSLVLKRAIQYFKEKYAKDPKRYAVLGPTGPSAIALEGQTIHSFAGIGIPRTVEDFEKTTKNKKKWKDLQVLILDEASMVSAEFFDRLSQVVSRIRNDLRPFGGIQLIICGDFLQLPPIPPRKADVDEMREAFFNAEDGGFDDDGGNEWLFLNRGFLFQSHAWQAANFQVIELEQVFRQKNRDFVRVLQELRRGRMTPEGLAFLKEKCRRPLPPNEFGIRPTILHSTNVHVNRENEQELRKLPGSNVMVYNAVDTVEREEAAPPWAENQLEKNQFFSNCIAEKQLSLKIGAQVMLIKNEGRNAIGRYKTKKLVNGSRGKVVDFVKVSSPGLDLDGPSALPGVEYYPVVQFINGAKKVIEAETFQSRLVGLGTCTRLAIPLRLAWAITTHKAQGLTLDFVIADVGAVFAEAQTYVALSRASDENGLELRNFSPKRSVRANQMALSFYDNLFDSNANGTAAVYPLWDGREPKSQTVHRAKLPNHMVGLSTNDASSEIEREDTTPLSSTSLMGKTVVFSGVMRSLSRKKAQSLVEQCGGIVRGSVSGKTDYLVLGSKRRTNKMSAAHVKALAIVKSGSNQSAKLKILAEQTFLQMVTR